MKPGTADITILGICFIALQILWITTAIKNGEKNREKPQENIDRLREHLEKIFNS